MVQRLGTVDVALQEQGREGGVDDEVVLVGFNGASLLERALAKDRVGGAEGSQRGDDSEDRQGLDFDGDGGPFREQPRLEFPVVSYTDKLSGVGSNKLFLVQTRPATLYTIELLVDFVRTVKSEIYEGILGERVELDVLQSGLNDCLAGLITGGNEVDLGDAVVLQRLDGFYNVNNSTAGTNANILRRGIEMVGDSPDGSIAFGGFNVCHWNDCGGEGGGAVEGNGSEDRREAELTMARSSTRTSDQAGYLCKQHSPKSHIDP